MILVLRNHFSSAHLYSQNQWTEDKNKIVFGRCYTAYGHGHNYTLEVGFKTTEDNLSTDQNTYKDILKKLTNVLDHEHLNFVIPEFKEMNPTTENIALYFLDKLKTTVSEKNISYIKLFETDNLWTEIHL
ncbi:MAG: 6-carboxytetrahydropterin synthase [Pseudobdellovibrionaceae bacterium]